MLVHNCKGLDAAIRQLKEENKMVNNMSKKQAVNLNRACHREPIIEGSAVPMSGGVHQQTPSYFQNEICNIVGATDSLNPNRVIQMKKCKVIE